MEFLPQVLRDLLSAFRNALYFVHQQVEEILHVSSVFVFISAYQLLYFIETITLRVAADDNNLTTMHCHLVVIP